MPARGTPTTGDPQLGTAARRRLRAAVAEHRLPCTYCGTPIDYSLRWPDPWSYALDERTPRAHGGRADDPANVRPAHVRCNAQAGTAMTNNARRAARAPLRPDTAEHW